MAIIILILCILVCVVSVFRLRDNKKQAEEWNKTGVNMGKKADTEDILVLLTNLKLPEEKNVRLDDNKRIIIELNKVPYLVNVQEDQVGNTIVRFGVEEGKGKDSAYGIEITWLYEFFQDEVMHTNRAEVYYKKSNSNARKLLFGIIGIVICIIVIANGDNREEKKIKNTAPIAYPDITYEEAFEGYFTGYFMNKPKWYVLEDENGNKTFEFRGSLPAARTKLEALDCEEIVITFDIYDERMTLNDVVIYGDLETYPIIYKREMSPIMDTYVVEFLFEYAKGLEEGEPNNPLGYAFVKLVQSGSLAKYPDSPIGKAFKNAFTDKCEWKYFLSDTRKDIVEFNGAIDDTIYRMQFIIDEDCEHFSLDYMEVNGEAMPDFIREMILLAVFAVDEMANVDIPNIPSQYYESNNNSDYDVTYDSEDEWDWVEGDGFENQTMEEILEEKKQLYGDVQYTLLDIGTDGYSELLVNYGEIEADKVTEIYTYDVECGMYYYADCIPGTSVLYQAEDGKGILAVQGSQGVEWLYHIKEDGFVSIELLSEKELGPDEEYYSNSNPIIFFQY